MTVENSYETHGQSIDIFALKNMGWLDSQQFDHLNNGNSFNILNDAELVARINKIVATNGKQ